MADGIVKQKCPNCNRLVEFILTDHEKPGSFNCCIYCISHPEKFKGLQGLNQERKNKYYNRT